MFNLNRKKHGYSEPGESSVNIFLIAVTLAAGALLCMLLVVVLRPLLFGEKKKYEVVPYGSGSATPVVVVPTLTPLLPTVPPTVLPVATAVPTLAQVRITAANASSLQPLVRLPGHSSTVSSVAFSADSRLMASADWSGKVQVWDVATSTLLYSFQSVSNRVDSVAFSPDGTRLAAAGQDNYVRWWNLSTKIALPDLSGPTATVNALAFSPDGSLIAAASDDQNVYLWDGNTGAPRLLLTGHASYVTSVAFSPDGKLIAAGGEDDTLRVWNLPGGSPLGTLQGHTSAVASVTFSPDSRSLLSAGADHTVRLWNLLSMSQVGLFTGHTENVTSAAFSPDGLLVASGAGGIEDNTIRLWDARTYTQILSILPGGPVNAVAFSPDGTRLAAGGATFLTEWGIPSGPTAAVPAAAPTITLVAVPTTQFAAPTIQPASATTGEPCLLTVRAATAELRAGPGAAYALVSQLPLNQNVQSDGWTYGDEGYVWWRLGASGWVRGDAFLDAQNTTLPTACQQLMPIEQVPATPATSGSVTATPAPATTPNAACVLVTQLDEVNVRSGPGTGYPATGKLALNQSLQGTGWAFDDDGFVWWKIASGGWVRADTVTFPESCQTLPQASP